MSMELYSVMLLTILGSQNLEMILELPLDFLF